MITFPDGRQKWNGTPIPPMSPPVSQARTRTDGCRLGAPRSAPGRRCGIDRFRLLLISAAPSSAQKHKLSLPHFRRCVFSKRGGSAQARGGTDRSRGLGGEISSTTLTFPGPASFGPPRACAQIRDRSSYADRQSWRGDRAVRHLRADRRESARGSPDRPSRRVHGQDSGKTRSGQLRQCE